MSTDQEEALQATKGKNPLARNQRSMFSVLEKTGDINKDTDMFSNNIQKQTRSLTPN